MKSTLLPIIGFGLFWVFVSFISIENDTTEFQRQIEKAQKLLSQSENVDEYEMKVCTVTVDIPHLSRIQTKVPNWETFVADVRMYSALLRVPPKWYLEVINFESRFETDLPNPYSGAIGLIQWIRPTARDMGYSLEEIEQMSHRQQLHLSYKYLSNVRGKYGDFESVGDLYAGVWWPKSLDMPIDSTIFEKGQLGYDWNAVLDEDRDNRITRNDLHSVFLAKD